VVQDSKPCADTETRDRSSALCSIFKDAVCTPDVPAVPSNS